MNLLQHYTASIEELKERTDESVMKKIRAILNTAVNTRYFGRADIARACYDGLCEAGLEDRVLIIFTREGAKIRLIKDHQPDTITGVIDEIHLKEGAKLPRWSRVGGKRVPWDEDEDRII